MIKISAELMAGLVFNEQCEIVVSDSTEDKEINTYKSADEFIQDVFEHNDFKRIYRNIWNPSMQLVGWPSGPMLTWPRGKLNSVGP